MFTEHLFYILSPVRGTSTHILSLILHTPSRFLGRETWCLFSPCQQPVSTNFPLDTGEAERGRRRALSHRLGGGRGREGTETEVKHRAKTCFGYKGMPSHLFLEHSVVLLEPNHSPVCQFPFFFFFFHRSRAPFTVLHLCSRPIPCSEMDGSASGERPAFLAYSPRDWKGKERDGEMVQQPAISCWFRGSTGKKPGPPRGHTAVRAATGRASRKTLGARSPPGSLVEGGAEFQLPLPNNLGRCAERGGCGTRKAGWEVSRALTSFKSLGQEAGPNGAG